NRAVLAAINVVVLLAGVVFAVRGDTAEAPADGAVAEVDGVATVVRDGGSPESLVDGAIVAAGDEVQVESGSVVLRLTDGGVLEARAATRVVVGAVPELVQGDLLVLGNGVAVDAAGTVVTLD